MEKFSYDTDGNRTAGYRYCEEKQLRTPKTIGVLG